MEGPADIAQSRYIIVQVNDNEDGTNPNTRKECSNQMEPTRGERTHNVLVGWFVRSSVPWRHDCSSAVYFVAIRFFWATVSNNHLAYYAGVGGGFLRVRRSGIDSLVTVMV